MDSKHDFEHEYPACVNCFEPVYQWKKHQRKIKGKKNGLCPECTDIDEQKRRMEYNERVGENLIQFSDKEQKKQYEQMKKQGFF